MAENLVQDFKAGIAWYQPTTDTDSWKYFYDTVYSIDYTNATAESLKRVAWNAGNLKYTLDYGMWLDRWFRLHKFLGGAMTMNDDDPIQLEFIACFINNYSKAAHNNDLWQSINDSATRVLKASAVSAKGERAPAHDATSPAWLLPAIPACIYSAFKEINLSYYRPTEDTETWAQFQAINFDLTLLDSMYIVYKQMYLLQNIWSGADSGIWAAFASAALAFMQANFPTLPTTADTQIDLAISFCNVFGFNYAHAAHNSDLFKLYSDAFADAAVKLQALKARLA